MYTLNCNGTLIDLNTPRVMGIINVTPDSFYDGGKWTSLEAIEAQARIMVSQGASFLDVGGYSSRPGANEVPVDEEMDRVLPVVASLYKSFPHIPISIDTFRSRVAKAAVAEGAAMVNDISGGLLDEEMLSVVADLQVPYIMMHMRGTPQNMTSKTQYENVTQEVLSFFAERISLAREAGINDLVVDPGFGFAKTAEQSFELLRHLELFDVLDLPYLVGVSRKSMIYKTLGSTPGEALNGTTALHSVALLKGASVLRVHDVKEAVECVTLIEKLRGTS
ncbi:MAG: dihydropteroate synthase [Bacteroidota bacterium]